MWSAGSATIVAGCKGEVRIVAVTDGRERVRITHDGRNLSGGEWHRYLGDLPWQPTCESWPTPED